MYERAKKFIKNNRFDDIFNDYSTKEQKIVKELIDICSNIRKLELGFDIPAFCPNCALKSRIEQGLEIIQTYLKQKDMIKSKSKCNYRFKKGNGMGIVVNFNGTDYTNNNLTDEVAEALINHNKANKMLFDIMPVKEPEVQNIGGSEGNKNETDFTNFTEEELIQAAALKNVNISSHLRKDGTIKGRRRASIEKLLK